MLFKKHIRTADTKLKADIYVYTCAAKFLEMGYSQEDVDVTVDLMKHAVWEWSITRFPGSTTKEPSPVGDVGKDLRDIQDLEPSKTYWFKMIGDHAARLKYRLVKYETDLKAKRKTPAVKSFHKDLIGLTLDKSAYA